MESLLQQEQWLPEESLITVLLVECRLKSYDTENSSEPGLEGEKLK